MNTPEVEMEIIEAMVTLTNSVRKQAGSLLSVVTDDQLLNLMNKNEHMAFLTGWLEAKGFDTVEIDLSPETSIKLWSNRTCH